MSLTPLCLCLSLSLSLSLSQSGSRPLSLSLFLSLSLSFPSLRLARRVELGRPRVRAPSDSGHGSESDSDRLETPFRVMRGQGTAAPATPRPSPRAFGPVGTGQPERGRIPNGTEASVPLEPSLSGSHHPAELRRVSATLVLSVRVIAARAMRGLTCVAAAVLPEPDRKLSLSAWRLPASMLQRHDRTNARDSCFWLGRAPIMIKKCPPPRCSLSIARGVDFLPLRPRCRRPTRGRSIIAWSESRLSRRSPALFGRRAPRGVRVTVTLALACIYEVTAVTGGARTRPCVPSGSRPRVGGRTDVRLRPEEPAHRGPDKAAEHGAAHSRPPKPPPLPPQPPPLLHPR